MSGTFQVGLRVLLSLAKTGDATLWYRSKLDVSLFRGQEIGLYQAFLKHIEQHKKLPALTTVYEKYPDLVSVAIDDAPSYYLDSLNTRYVYDLINTANIDSQKILQADKGRVKDAADVLQVAMMKIKNRENAPRLIDFGAEAGQIILDEYHSTSVGAAVSKFYWDYLDNLSGGARGGDVISVVGRPAAGKSWVLFRTAGLNWRYNQQDSLVVSMEMNALSVSQRLATMYAGTNLTQLKKKGYASPTYQRFVDGLQGIATEKGKLWVIDGNLAADIEDIYLLASQLQVKAVYIDGAYLVRTKDKRLSRYERVPVVAENIKSFTSSLEIPSFASWQFNRKVTEVKKGGQNKSDGMGLEHIGMTDVIGQLSSVVIAMMQEESVETLESRVLSLLKGRDGETGQWRINWDFVGMNFDQLDSEGQKHLDYI